MVHVGATLPEGFRTVSVVAHSVVEILAALQNLGHAVADVMEQKGEPGAEQVRIRTTQVIATLEARMARVAALVAPLPRRKVLCLEWLDPFYNAGHWMPELVARAGGVEPLGRPGMDSVRMTWDEVRAAQPDVLVVTPCSFDLPRAVAEAESLRGRPGLASIPAVHGGEVWAVWADRYFSGSSPRVVDGIEILAALLYPEVAGHLLPPGAAQRVDLR